MGPSGSAVDRRATLEGPRHGCWIIYAEVSPGRGAAGVAAGEATSPRYAILTPVTDEIAVPADLPTTVAGALERAARLFPDMEALVDGDLRLSFPELLAAADEAGRALIAAGIEPGDRVAIWAPNCAEWVVAVLGHPPRRCRARAAQHPLQGRRGGLHPRTRSRARLLFTVTDFLDTDYVELLGDRAELPHLEQIVVLRGARRGHHRVGRLPGQRRPRCRPTPPPSAPPPSAPTTSPTSSSPPAPPGSRRGPCSATRRSCGPTGPGPSVVGLREGDRYLIVNPFFHSFGLKVGHPRLLLKGATIIPHAVFDVPHGDGAGPGGAGHDAPRAAHDLPDDPRPPRPRPLRHLDAAPGGHRRGRRPGRADPPDARGARRSRRSSPATGSPRPTAWPPCAATTTTPRPSPRPRVGRIPGIEVRVVDDDGNEVPRGEPGEIVIRGYNVMPGYLENPEATAEAIDADGWLHTGDIGVMDDAGYLRITDRIKDMFIVGGFNAYPAEIENVILRHPAVAQVAVVGVPDERMGEVGMAFVVLRPGRRARPRPSSSRGAARRWPTTRCRATCASSTCCPSTPATRC